jgi:hypothetical protein
MKPVSFYACSDYVEHFWNKIGGMKELDREYTHLVTEEDAQRWVSLKAGQTVHMMMSLVSGSRALRLVSEAVTSDIDDTELNRRVEELRVAGALCITHTTVETYDEAMSPYRMREGEDEDKWDLITRLRVRESRLEALRRGHEYFVENARIFTTEELEVIDNYHRAKEAYDKVIGGTNGH